MPPGCVRGLTPGSYLSTVEMMQDPPEKKVAILEWTAACIILFIVLTVLTAIFLYRPG